jgi:radical SAM superfamily enzyme YgiQ (UPF0313 family)
MAKAVPRNDNLREDRVMTRCLMVYPEFRSASFWNYRETCRLLGARYPAAPLGLVTVAAMLPKDWDVRLVDRNVQTWDDGAWDWADIVLIGGMMPQQRDALWLISEARRRGKTVVVGGPDATSSPHLYAEADHLVLGEAEITLPQFLADRAAGAAQKMYAAGEQKADVTQSPCPRFDLLQFGKYLHVGVQWCRGCPFNCELCDIIELFGRVPRAKTSPQMLHELQTLYDLGYRGHVDLVDDNFIGNKKLVKAFLPQLKTWMEAHRWPFEFTTEASLNLADDEALLAMMQDVGFCAVFVGIESPDEQTLIDTQKRQNTRRSIVESVRKIYAHGMFVNAGFIIGFDTEAHGVAEGMIRCVEETAIPVNMAGLLFALPGTQLSRRLTAQGRLHEGSEQQPSDDGDQCTAGLNYDTLRPKADILRDYLKVVETIYEPDRYFARVQQVALALNSTKRRFKPPFRFWLKELGAFGRLLTRFTLDRETRGHFWRIFVKSALKNPGSLRYTVALMGLYVHFGPFSKYVAERIRRDIAREEQSPSPVAVLHEANAPAA